MVPTNSKIEMWTVVQHSGYGYNQDPGFKQGLETRCVRGREIDVVLKAGGVLFPSYGSADDYAMREQYPREGGGIYPQAPGSFADTEVDGLALYLPHKREG